MEWINTWFTCMHVGFMCCVRYHIADLIYLVSVPQLINFAVDNFVQSMICSNSCMFLVVWSLLGPQCLV